MAGKTERGAAAVLELRRRLARWRRMRSSGSMPEALWRSAARLAESEGVSAIARALGLNYGNLKRRVESRGRAAARGTVGSLPLFVEVGRATSVGPSPALSKGESPRCVVEIEEHGGRHMAIRFNGQGPSDLASLCATLWKACR